MAKKIERILSSKANAQEKQKRLFELESNLLIALSIIDEKYSHGLIDDNSYFKQEKIIFENQTPISYLAEIKKAKAELKQETSHHTTFFSFLVLLIALSAIFFNPTLTGQVSLSSTTTEELILNEVFEGNSSLQLNLTNVSYLAINGEFEGKYLKIVVHGKEKSYTVYETRTKSTPLVTGNVVADNTKNSSSNETLEKNNHITEENTTEESDKSTTEFAINQTENNTESITEEINETINISKATNTTINITTTNQTFEEINTTINQTTEEVNITTNTKGQTNNTEEITPTNQTGETDNNQPSEENITEEIIEEIELNVSNKTTILNNECGRACLLVNEEIVKLEIISDGVLNLESIKYKVPKITGIEQTQQFENLEVLLGEEIIIQTNKYFKGAEFYDTTYSEGYTSRTENNKLIITPQKTGLFKSQVYASNGENVITSNEFYIFVKNNSNTTTNQTINTTSNLTEFQIIQEPARINEPVKWKVTGKKYEVDDFKQKLPKVAKIIREESLQEQEIFIYETPAPKSSIEKIKEHYIRQRISAEENVTNVTSYVDVPEGITTDGVKIYWLEEKKSIENFWLEDTNNNGKNDRINYLVPHLSNQTFDINITILNVQSYPIVGETWEVRFTTVGEADLIIEGINETTFGNGLPDDLTSTGIYCGESLISSNKTNDQIIVNTYSCNETGKHISTVHTQGSHYQKFTFGQVSVTARNFAACNFNGDEVITSDTNCDNEVLNATSITVNSGATLYINNVTLNSGYVVVNGFFEIRDSQVTSNSWLNITGNFTLDNSTLRVNVTGNLSHGISVKSGGQMFVGNNSLITNGGNNNYYRYEVLSGGYLNMQDSAVDYVGYVGGGGLGDGLALYSNANQIHRSTIDGHYRPLFVNSDYNNLSYLNITSGAGANFPLWITTTAEFNNLTGIRILTGPGAGGYFQGDNNTFRDFYSAEALIFEHRAAGNYFENFTIDTSGSYAWSWSSGSETQTNNNVVNCSISSSSGDGLVLSDGENNTFVNCVFNSGSSAGQNDVQIDTSAGKYYFLNSTFTNNELAVTSGTAVVQQYLTVYVSNGTNAINGAQVNVTSVDSILRHQGTTNSNGYAYFNVTEFNKTSSGITRWTDYTVDVGYANYISSSKTFNITGPYQENLTLIEITPPSVNLISPVNSSTSSNSLQTFICEINSTSAVHGVSLYSDISGSYQEDLVWDARTHQNDSNTTFLVRFDNSNISEENQEPATQSGITFSSGKINQGVQIDSSDVLDYPVSNNLDANKGTIEFWLYPTEDWDDIGSGYRVLFNSRSGAGNSFEWYFSGAVDQLIWSETDAAARVVVANTDWEANRWYHFALTWDFTADDYNMYLDGQLIANSTASLAAPTLGTNFRIGAYHDGTLQANSIFDDLRISNYAKTVEEINFDMNTSKKLFNASFAKIVPQGNYLWTCSAQNEYGNVTFASNNSLQISQGCAPSGDWIITNNTVCSDTSMNVNSITIPAGYSLKLSNTTLISGQTTIEGSFELADSKNTLWQNGNLTVSGTFNLSNSNLKMNVSTDGEFGINVTSSGSIIVERNSSISNGENASAGYFFHINNGASSNLVDSSISYAGYNSNTMNSGLWINNPVNINNFTLSNYYGIIIDSLAYGSNITNSTYISPSNGVFGFFITANNVTIINSNVSGINEQSLIGSGIYIESNNSVLNNLLLTATNSSNNVNSIILNNSNNITLQEVTVTDGSSLTIQNSSNNTFRSINAEQKINTPSISLIGNSNNNSFYDITINNSASTNSYSLLNNITLQTTNSFFNSSFYSLNSEDIYFDENSIGEINLTNTSFSSTTVNGQGKLNVYNYYEITVTDQIDNPIEGVNVNITTKYDGEVFNDNTLTNGKIPIQTIYSSWRNGTANDDYNNFTVIISHPGFDDITLTRNFSSSIIETVQLEDATNTCYPSSLATWRINQTTSCNDLSINAFRLVLLDTAELNLNNITLNIRGNSNIYGNFTITNSSNTIWQNGNLNIFGNYNLINSNLRMNGTSNGASGIYVNQSGSLIINESSNVTNGIVTSAGYAFEVNGSLELSDANVSRAGWSGTSSDSGIYVNGSLLVNNSFLQNYIGLRLASGASNGVIHNTTIKGLTNSAYGIYSSDATSLSIIDVNVTGIDYSAVVSNNYGMYFDSADSILLQNIYLHSIIPPGVLSNTYGIALINTVGGTVNDLELYDIGGSNSGYIQGLYVSASNNLDLHNILINNSQASLQDENHAAVFLINSQNLDLENLTIDDVGTSHLILENTDSSTVKNTWSKGGGTTTFKVSSTSTSNTFNDVYITSSNSIKLFANNQLYNNFTIINSSAVNFDSSNATIHNFTILDSTGNGIVVYEYTNLTAHNSLINNSNNVNLYLGEFTNCNQGRTYLYNTTLLPQSTTILSGSGCLIEAYWPINVYVNNTLGLDVNNAAVNITNVTGGSIINELTDSSGFTSTNYLKQFYQNNAGLYTSNNHTINVSKELQGSTTLSINISKSMTINVTIEANSEPTFGNMDDLRPIIDGEAMYEPGSPAYSSATGLATMSNGVSRFGQFYYRSFIDFNVSQIDDDAKITKAQVGLALETDRGYNHRIAQRSQLYADYASAAALYADLADSTFGSNVATWNTAGLSFAYHTLPSNALTDIESWLDVGTYPIGFGNVDEVTLNNNMPFYTEQAIGDTNTPRLNITYVIKNYTFETTTSITPFDVDGFFYDADGDSTLNYSFEGNSSIQISLDSDNNITFTPSTNFTGTEIINITATDSYGATAISNNFYVTVYSIPYIYNIVSDKSVEGYGFPFQINASINDAEGVSFARIEINPPYGSAQNYSMTNIASNIWQYNYTDWQNGTYYYKIWANSTNGYWNFSSTQSFEYSVNASAQIRTIKDFYTATYFQNQTVNITDPPEFDTEEISRPKILEAYVYPEDVRPDDLMTTTVIAKDGDGISSVYAHIYHEGGFDNVTLSLVEGSVNEGTWQHVWLVHNTIEKEYKTEVFVKDINGYTASKIINWTDPNTEWCYQETANVTPSCGGTNTGSYAHNTFLNEAEFYDAIDGNYNTPATLGSMNYFWVNYTIPSNANYGSRWQFKEIDGITKNITISSNCLDTESTLQLRVRVWDDWYGIIELYCYNQDTSSWISLDDSNSDGDGVWEEGLWWNLTKLITYTEFKGVGQTTNLDEISGNTQVENLIIDNAVNARIIWLENVTLNDSMNLDTAIDISSNYIFVDSNLYPTLNKSANITVYGEYSGLNILKDGVTCSDCSVIEIDADDAYVVFNVSSFSNYTWTEANQSKVTNDGTTNFTGYVYIAVQYYNQTIDTWILDDVVVNNEGPHQINTSGHLKFDQFFNGRWNTSQAQFGQGVYRVYAEFRDNESNVLKSSDGLNIAASYNFNYNISLIPEVDYLNFTPVNAGVNDDLLLNITCTNDYTQEILVAVFEIYKDGVNQTSLAGSQSITNNTNTIIQNVSSSLTLGGEEWSARARCYDDFTSSEWVWISQNITVTNDPPITPTVTINSTFGSDGPSEDLNCAATLEDVGGMYLNATVNWYKNGVLDSTIDYNNSYSVNTEFSATLGSGNTSIGDEWSCSIRTYDGQYFSGWGNSSNLTIINSSAVNDCTDITTPGRYDLLSNIIDSTDSVCINITSSNVQFDCNGLSIDSNGVGTTGLQVQDNSLISNVSINDCTITGWGQRGISATNVKNLTLTNIRWGQNSLTNFNLRAATVDGLTLKNISDATTNGYVYLDQVNNTLINNYSSSASRISLTSTINTTISNTSITLTANAITLFDDLQTTISNSVLHGSSHSINFGDATNTCSLEVNNVTDNEGKSILAYSSNVIVENISNASQYIFCHVENSKINNITIDGGVSKRNGILLFNVSDSNFTNISATRTTAGIRAEGTTRSSNNYFANILLNNSDAGLGADDMLRDGNYFDNLTIKNSVDALRNFYNSTLNNSNIYDNVNSMSLDYSTLQNTLFKNNNYVFSGSYNTLNNVTIKDNTYGLGMSNDVSNNIRNSKIINNTQYGISLQNAGIGSNPNYFSNNLFNNTNNIVFSGTIFTNYWNSTPQYGSRVYSNGPLIGGNYWANPSGTGFSETCTDTDNDGFCDSSYTVNTSNIDYLPYSSSYSDLNVSVQDVSIYPVSALINDDLSINASCVQNHSVQVLTAYYEIYKDGVNQTSLAGSLQVQNNTITTLTTISNTLTGDGDEWSARVRCYDGDSYSAWLNSNPNASISGPPVINSVTITNPSAYTNDTLNCVVNASSASLVQANISWVVQGRTVFSELNQIITSNANNTFSLNPAYSKISNITCSVNVFNSAGNVTSSDFLIISNYSSSISVTNSTPVANSLTYVYANFSRTNNFAAQNISRELGSVGWSNDIQTPKGIYSYDNSQRIIRSEFAVGGFPASGVTPEVYVWYGNGTQLFTQNPYYFYGLSTGDYNNDTFGDEMVYGVDGATILLNSDGSQNFSMNNNSYATEDVVYLIEDLDNDGLNEIIFGGENQVGSDKMIYGMYDDYTNLSTTPVWNYTIFGATGSAFRPESIDVADINLDGGLEVAFSHNNHFAQYGTPVFNASGSLVYIVNSAYGDGQYVRGIDLLNKGYNTHFAILSNTDDLRFYNDTNTSVLNLTGFDDTRFVVGDLNNDGFNNEIAISSTNSQTILVYTVNATSATLIYSVPVDQYSVAEDIKDFTNDGYNDILFSNSKIGIIDVQNNVTWTYNDGIGSFGSFPYVVATDWDYDYIYDLAYVDSNGLIETIRYSQCTIYYEDFGTFNMSWDSQTKLWTDSVTLTGAGTYNYNITCYKPGYQIQTYSSSLVIDNLNPDTPQVSLSSENGLNTTNEYLNCSTTITDPDSDFLNVTVQWFRNEVLYSTVDYNNSYSNNSFFNATLASSNTAPADLWQCSVRVHDGTSFSTTGFSNTLEILYDNYLKFQGQTPTDNSQRSLRFVEVNVSIFDDYLRNFTFDWNGSSVNYFSEKSSLLMNFDNNSAFSESASSFVDFSTYGNNGTCSNCPSINVSGYFGKALQYAGTGSNKVLVSDDESLKNFGEFTASAWVYPNSFNHAGGGNFPRIMAKETTTSAAGGFLICGLSDGRVRYGSPTGTSLDTSSSLNTGEWSHVLITVNTTHTLIYINGQVAASRSSVMLPAVGTPSLAIGNTPTAQTREWNGLIDEVRIWNKSFNYDEIQNIYFSTLKKLNSTNWEFYTNQSKNSTTELDYGTYTYQAFSQSNQTEQRTITLSLAPAPTVDYINLTPLNPNYDDDLYLNVTCSDVNPDANITAFYEIYKDGIIQTSLTGNVTVINASNQLITTIGSANTSVGENWYARVRCYNELTYSNWNNSNNVTIQDLNAPNIAWISPTPNNNTVQLQQYVELNATINETQLDKLTFNWNGTNYTLLDNDLIMYYNFDNVTALGENSTILKDLSGNNYDGVISSSVTVGTGGYYGGAFVSTDDTDLSAFVNMSDIDDFDGTQHFSVSVWFKRAAPGERISIGRQDQLAATDEITVLAATPAGNVFFGFNDGSGWAGEYFASNDANWHHVVFTFDGTQSVGNRVRGWLDGVEQTLLESGTIDSAFPSSSIESWRIGVFQNLGTNGSIDNLMLWNRTLSDSEVQQLYMSNLKKVDNDSWNLYINKTKNSTELLDYGTYDYKVYATDTSGNSNVSETRRVIITFNQTPTVDYINLTPISPSPSKDLYLNLTCSDFNTGDLITSYWEVYKNGVNQTSYAGSSTVSNGVNTLIQTISNTDTAFGEEWSARAYCTDGNTNSEWTWISQNVTISNNIPSVPVLVYPLDNSTIIIRRPNFEWNASTDSDGDALTYQINISNPSGACYTVFTTVGETNYSVTNNLCINTNNQRTYNWSVRAYDGTNYSAWSQTFNFSVESVVDLLILDNSSALGRIDRGGTNNSLNTSDPFELRNDGNVYINLTIAAESGLWDSVSLNTDYFQYQSFDSEVNSFNNTLTPAGWLNVSNVSTILAADFDWENTSDQIFIHFQATGPWDELPGTKTSTLNITGEYTHD